jgi:hypothetical protein
LKKTLTIFFSLPLQVVPEMLKAGCPVNVDDLVKRSCYTLDYEMLKTVVDQRGIFEFHLTDEVFITFVVDKLRVCQTYVLAECKYHSSKTETGTFFLISNQEFLFKLSFSFQLQARLAVKKSEAAINCTCVRTSWSRSVRWRRTPVNLDIDSTRIKTRRSFRKLASRVYHRTSSSSSWLTVASVKSR